jgi:hypothetical protein
MSLKVLAKLVALLTALTATIVAISWLNAGHMNSFWTSLGVDRSGTRLNWCEERVGTLFLYDSKAKLTEKDGKWLWVGEIEKELDYLRVEKWFAKYCLIPVDDMEVAEMASSSPVFEAQFIDGNRLSLYSDGENIFKIRDKVFQSQAFREALQELLAFGGEIQ